MKFTREGIKQILAGRARRDVLANIIKKCAISGAEKSNATPHIDDIEQELWIFLNSKVQTLDEGRNIEPWLIEVARLTGLTYRRKFSMFGTEGEDARVDEDDNVRSLNDVDVYSEDDDGRKVDRLDQEKAAQSLLAGSAWLREQARREEGHGLQGVKNKGADNELGNENMSRTPNPDQKKLRNLRLKLGLTQTGMALRLGIKLPTYQAYEYARTKAVPRDTMKAAKLLASDHRYSYVEEKYGGRAMADIAAEWAKRMGVTPNSPAALADALGINKSTTSRWYRRDDTARIEPEELLIYEDRVRRQAKFNDEQKQRRAASRR